MNLNGYLGLMGGSYREVQTVTGTALAACEPGICELSIADPDYVATLDADSVLLAEYCLRLVHLLEQNEYREMAIAQTPYSAFPGSATRLERIADATRPSRPIRPGPHGRRCTRSPANPLPRQLPASEPPAAEFSAGESRASRLRHLTAVRR
jgi:hypothetical protein